jgi:hypothetical protein
MRDILTRVNPMQAKGRTYAVRTGSTVNGIFDNEFFEVDPLSGVGVARAQPRLVCTTADLPSGAASLGRRGWHRPGCRS